MRILHVETGMNLYGGALQVHYLLRGLAGREDVENVLVCPEGSAIAEAARENVRTLHPVPMKGDLDLLFVPRLLGIIRKECPDIIHLHSRRGADILGG
ncbi:glycosyltransferase family 1 protein, partial [bacterium]|nr:glycosyltransferase family 1 protein [bacterium]